MCPGLTVSEFGPSSLRPPPGLFPYTTWSPAHPPPLSPLMTVPVFKASLDHGGAIFTLQSPHRIRLPTSFLNPEALNPWNQKIQESGLWEGELRLSSTHFHSQREKQRRKKEKTRPNLNFLTHPVGAGIQGITITNFTEWLFCVCYNML